MFTINTLINYFISRNVIPLKSNLGVTYNHKHPTKHLTILVPAPLSLCLVPYFHKFSAVEFISAENVILLVLFGTNLHFVRCKPLLVLFETNLMSNISSKAPCKHHIQCTICIFFVQIMHYLIKQKYFFSGMSWVPIRFCGIRCLQNSSSQ